MDWWLWLIVAIAVLALGYVAQRLGWVDLSDKSRRGGGGGVLGVGDEVFHPAKHEAQVEMDRQTVLPAPAPAPGDGDKGIADHAGTYRGSMRIELPRD